MIAGGCEVGELELIEWVRRRIGPSKGVLIGPGDDAAALEFPPGEPVLATVDSVVDGVHFDLARHRPEEIGAKAIKVSLSDVAAMAGTPLYCLVEMGIPAGTDEAVLHGIFEGLKRAADRHSTAVVGGNVVRSARLSVSTTLLGTVSRRRIARRGGARPGQSIFVTGDLGGSGLGKHISFEPRLREGKWLAENCRLGAMIDVSDGLSSDLHHVAAESGVGMILEAAAVPISPDALRAAEDDGRSPLEHALNDGEDYELLFTVDEGDAETLAKRAPFKTSRIGSVLRTGKGVFIRLADGREAALERGGWKHL